MKNNHPAIHFLFLLLAFALLAGCEKKEKDVVAQGGVGSAKTVMVSTFVGGEEGFADGKGGDAKFHRPSGIVIDVKGNFYVADTYNNRIRKITPKGEVTTFAGGEEGFADGVGDDAKFYRPEGIAIDTAGNLYVSDRENNRIRRITPEGEVSTLAGGEKYRFSKGIGSFADGSGSDARFDNPLGITIDAKGNLYVADRDNHRIRKIEILRR